jgi:hypothetical protein
MEVVIDIGLLFQILLPYIAVILEAGMILLLYRKIIRVEAETQQRFYDRPTFTVESEAPKESVNYGVCGICDEPIINEKPTVKGKKKFHKKCLTEIGD